jgi:hypothetical protein
LFRTAIELPVIDLSDLPRDNPRPKLSGCWPKTRQPYNLAEPPLMRAKLLRLDEQEYVFVLNFHHMYVTAPRWSFFTMSLRRLRVFSDGKVSTLPSLPVQYADYAVWQPRSFREVLESQLAY